MHKKNKLLAVYSSARNSSHCKGCGRFFNEKDLVKKLCKSCYSAWSRQKKKWRERSQIVLIGNLKTNYRLIALKIYGKFPFCHDCGSREWGWTNPVNPQWKGVVFKNTTIHIHHIDRDKKNNSIENLVPVCASCHKHRHIKLSTS